MSGNTMMVKGEDGQMVECEIISSKVKDILYDFLKTPSHKV